MATFVAAPPPSGAAGQRLARPGGARGALSLPTLGPIQRLFWVAPGGRTGGSGTERDPFGTPHAARDAARGLLAHMAGDVLIVLRGGRYQLESTLALGASDSGQNGYRVRYAAAPGEEPVLSGGVPITGWRAESTPAGGWLWSAPLPAVFASLPQPAPRQIYVNGVRASRVRGAWPTGGGVLHRTSTGFTLGPNPLAAWRNPSSIEFVYRIQWMEQRLGVAAVSAVAITMADTDALPWTAATTMFGTTYAPGGPDGHKEPDFVEHAYELLSYTRRGQFWVDVVGHRLYYVPRQDEIMSSATVLAPALDALCTLEGTSAVSLEGLTFAEGGWTGVNQTGLAEVGGNQYFASGADLAAYMANQTSAQLNAVISQLPGAVRAHACTDVRVRECTFVRCGGAGLVMTGGCDACTAWACTFSDLSGGALAIKGSTQALNRVQECTAHDCNLEYVGGDGMTITGGTGTLISGNHIYNQPYIGLDVVQGGLVERNHVHDAMQIMVDGGQIYSYGASDGITVRRNVCACSRSYAPGGVLYLDDGSSNKTLQNNVLGAASGPVALYNNPVPGPATVSYNFSDAATQHTGAGLTLFGMNRLISGGSPAPASIVGAAGPDGPPAATCTAPLLLGVLSEDPVASTVVLGWSAPAQGSPSCYEVWADDLCVGTTTGLTFSWADLSPERTYVFTVRAADAGGGASVPSAPLVFTASADTSARSTYGSGWE